MEVSGYQTQSDVSSDIIIIPPPSTHVSSLNPHREQQHPWTATRDIVRTVSIPSIKILNQLKQLRRIESVIPLAYEPPVKLFIIDYDTVRSFVDPGTCSVTCTDSNRFPTSVVGVGWQAVHGERKETSVELELGAVKVGAGSGCVHEDWVCKTSSGVVCLYYYIVSFENNSLDGNTYMPSRCTL